MTTTTVTTTTTLFNTHRHGTFMLGLRFTVLGLFNGLSVI